MRARVAHAQTEGGQLREFYFEANSSINPAVVRTLGSYEWVKKGQPLRRIGDPGTGKSHLLIAFGFSAFGCVGTCGAHGRRERRDRFVDVFV
ncbi:ATP-binding protein [Nocardiopsis exhalans]|uniref:ATP-binding protein n=1 Tax=Nocardiopsis exhalans TaxID=163604 RepID=A0ABY5DBS3_9ACTN|nr:ATP-binding protein [Nocardiopsis exhalans]USY20465.1 ATP-binding protein [Nocardiopsis exhalans]